MPPFKQGLVSQKSISILHSSPVNPMEQVHVNASVLFTCWHNPVLQGFGMQGSKSKREMLPALINRSTVTCLCVSSLYCDVLVFLGEVSGV